MAFADLARMYTSTTGTGTMTLTTPVTGAVYGDFLSFTDAGIQSGASVSYTILDGTKRATGRGVYTNSGGGITLTRDANEESSDGGVLGGVLNLTGPDTQVAVTVLARDLLIESGTISSPVEYLDIDLPSGYDLFRFDLVDLLHSVNSTTAGSFSPDGGATFYYDLDTFDTYVQQFLRTRSISTIDSNNNAEDGLLSLTTVLAHVGMNIGINLRCHIYPGSASVYAQIATDGEYYSSTFSSLVLEKTRSRLTVLGRQNLFRLQPYGNGDVNPPTSGHTITAGSWFLYGIPTP